VNALDSDVSEDKIKMVNNRAKNHQAKGLLLAKSVDTYSLTPRMILFELLPDSRTQFLTPLFVRPKTNREQQLLQETEKSAKKGTYLPKTRI
jgi:hypothetical protein